MALRKHTHTSKEEGEKQNDKIQEMLDPIWTQREKCWYFCITQIRTYCDCGSRPGGLRIKETKATSP